MRTTVLVTFPGATLKRGFWLYVWRVTIRNRQLLYVGRTGDSSSAKATAPYTRMGQHLGGNKNSNALRRYLSAHNIPPEACKQFELIAHGPFFEEAADLEAHIRPRDTVAALEKALAEGLTAGGYHVLNSVHCRKTLNVKLWRKVKTIFAQHFPGLARA